MDRLLLKAAAYRQDEARKRRKTSGYAKLAAVSLVVGATVYTPYFEGYQSGVTGLSADLQWASWGPDDGIATVRYVDAYSVILEKADGKLVWTKATQRVLLA